jgi:hypothetical protein
MKRIGTILVLALASVSVLAAMASARLAGNRNQTLLRG